MELHQLNTCILYHLITLPMILIVTSSNNEYYEPEVRVIVDRMGVKKWTTRNGKSIEDLRIQMNETFREMNDIYYQSLKEHGLSITLLMKDLVVLDYNIAPPDFDDKINAWPMLAAFTKWVKSNNTLEENQRYDLSVLFTGLDLYLYAYSQRDQTTGLSTVGRVCSIGGSVGVLELSGTPKDAFIGSHEIAHILGAEHDGIDPVTSSCNTSDGYVMSQWPRMWMPNHVYFSSCSAQRIRDNIARLDSSDTNCLAKINDISPVEDSQG